MKTCKNCLASLPLSDFYGHPNTADKKAPSCKACTKQLVAARAAKLALDPEWQEKERERHRIKQRRYREQGRASIPTPAQKKETMRKYFAKYPEKYRAHIACQRLPKQPCSVCGNPKAEKHHEDYTKPLAVEWLCTKHHAERHVQKRSPVKK